MSNQFLKLRRSTIPGKKPDTGSLDFGEIALNTHDGLAFMKKSGSLGEEIIVIGSTSGSFSGSFIGNVTGSLQGTASWANNAVSASYTLSASNAQTASYVLQAVSSSHSQTASYVLQAVSASNAQTASYAPNYLPLTGGTINGNVIINGTASITFLNVTYESASVIYSSGSNVFGDALNDTQTLIGTVIVSGSQQITGSLNAPNITGSLQGTASWAINAITSSYILQAESASYALTASYVENAQTASNILGGKATHVPFFITDTSLATSSIYQSGSTTIIINQDNATEANPEALYVWQPSTSSFNVISGKGNLNNYLQLNIQNTNQGNNASSDVVATAGNGNENGNYVDMGINGPNFNGSVGGPNDAYLYTTGSHFHIGNASPNQPIQFFVGGFDTDANRKFELNANGYHNITGSLNISDSLIVKQGITGSLYGTASYAITASYALNVPATASYAISASHALQADNASTANYASIAGNGGVTQLTAGSGITLLPSNGLGNVTVIAGGGGGITIISGSNITASFLPSTTWVFNHNLGTRTPIITVFDSNYNQVIPQNIQLVNTASATITFPTAESGFAIASLGGTTGTVLSSSYSLFSTYADTASYYQETDPIFVAKSASLATTGSNIFRGTQTITGSLNISGSTLQIGNNTLTGNTILSGSISISGSSTIQGTTSMTGSLLITGSTTQSGNNFLIGNTVLSGSISVSGSQNFKGTLDLTGSLIVSGSTIQIGNNTLTGNTSLTGSIIISGSTTNEIIGNTEVIGEFNVSGSSIFRNSTFTVTGSTFVKGTTNISGSTNITGSLNVTGNVNVISGSAFYRWGNKLFNYGAFSDLTTQSGSANTAYAIKFNTTDIAEGMSLSGSSAMKIENTGVYNFQWSGQLHQGAGASIVSIWLVLNGNAVPGSRGDVTLASNDDALPSWNYVLPFNANDAIQLYWSSTSGNTTWVFSPTGSTPPRPSTASIIATITQIA